MDNILLYVLTQIFSNWMIILNIVFSCSLVIWTWREIRNNYVYLGILNKNNENKNMIRLVLYATFVFSLTLFTLCYILVFRILLVRTEFSDEYFDGIYSLYIIVILDNTYFFLYIAVFLLYSMINLLFPAYIGLNLLKLKTLHEQNIFVYTKTHSIKSSDVSTFSNNARVLDLSLEGTRGKEADVSVDTNSSQSKVTDLA